MTSRIRLRLEDSVGTHPQVTRAPHGAPNVVLIVLDDLGFAQLGCFGSDIRTPHIDGLASTGLRYNRFHVTALCSPTRASLLTGRNHHAVGMGFLSELALGYPGYTGTIPKTAGALPRVLRDAGYSTLAVGKWHLTPGNEQTAAGPFDRWPLGLGFERYYGFLTAETNQWAPALVSDNHFIDQPRGPGEGYHLTTDLADQAIRFVYDVAHHAPGKPFFLYFAPGAMHAPHQVPREWIDRYAGAYDAGWDAWRDSTFARQQATGVVPKDARISPRPSWVQAWSETPASRRPLYARMQEVYAGFLSHTDAQIGRLLGAIDALGVMDNTLVLVLSDNGASSEGGPYGTFNNQARQVDTDESEIEAMIRDWGQQGGYYHYAWAWAWAGNTPFRLWKRYSWLGGVRTPLIARWPKNIKDAGAVRSQFCHAIDVMPTVLEACGVAQPAVIDGVTQQRVDGASLLASFERADAPSPRERQYFEIVGSRAIVSGEWKATTDHIGRGNIWEQRLLEGSRRFEDDHWALFHLPTDFAETTDVASEHPDVVRRLVDEWMFEAGRNNVLPITDAMHGRAPDQVMPPTYPPHARSVFRPGGSPIFDKWVPAFGAGAHITADVDMPDGTSEGILCALGDRNSGFAFYVRDGALVFAMSAQGNRAKVSAPFPKVSGRHALTCVLSPNTEEHITFTLEIDGRPVGSVRERIVLPPLWQFGGSGLCLGYDRPLSVTEDYEPPFRWSGVLHSLVIDVPTAKTPDVSAEIRATLKAE